MASILIGFFTVALLLLCVFIVLIILMQKPSANAGMGAALGGGAAESAFGGQTNNVLTRITIFGATAFFILCFGLYLGYMATMDADGKTSAQYHAEVKALAEAAAAQEAEAKQQAAKDNRGTLTQPIADPLHTPETDAEAKTSNDDQAPSETTPEATPENTEATPENKETVN